MNPNFTFQSPRAQANLWKIEQHFLPGVEDLEVSAIAELLDMSPRNARQYIEYLYTTKRLHVGSWRRRTRWGAVKRYRWGPGRDAPRPKPYTKAELCKRHRKANPEKDLKDIIMKRAKRIKPRRDSLTTAFFGPPA